MSSLLEGLTILDLSHRLPGPLASKVLADQGARVIKIEDERFKDPFITGLFAEMDNSFPDWYEHLNENKEIMRFDFSLEEDQKKIQQLALSADGIIMGLPLKLQQKLGVTKEDLNSKMDALSVIELKASSSKDHALHDLNALAEAGLLTHFVANRDEKRIAPPFFPIAGIAFGQQVATDLLAALLKSKKLGSPVFSTSYLDETTIKIFKSFYSDSLKEKGMHTFLHNGLYPCYNIYQSSDKSYFALAAVEEKFWNNFCELFSLDIPAEKRFFHEDSSIFKKVEKMFEKTSSEDILKALENQNCCLSLIS